jgi:hypothetical protein
MANEKGLYHLQHKLTKWKPNKIDPNLKRDLEHGWMVKPLNPNNIATSPVLLHLDVLTWQRWEYWGETMLAGKMLDEPIPQIEFDFGSCRNAEGEGSGARGHIEKCLDLIPQHGSWLGWSSWQYFDYFMDWLLFGFGYHGQPEEPTEPPGCTGASMRLYQYFNLAWLVCYPWDYFGAILAANKHGRSLGFYPTPMPVVNMMTEMLMRGQDCRDKTVLDPCLGTGRMLLYASNYSLRLHGQDINPTVIKASLVNGYLYAPWMVRPFPFWDEFQHNGHIETPDGRTVSAVVSDEMTSIPEAQQPNVAEYLADTEHDTEQQWKFEPIKKRRKKGQKNSDEPEAYQGCLF